MKKSTFKSPGKLLEDKPRGWFGMNEMDTSAPGTGRVLTPICRKKKRPKKNKKVFLIVIATILKI